MKRQYGLMIGFLLTGVWSTLMVYSASYPASISRYNMPNTAFAIRQALFFLIGLLLFLVASRISRKFLTHPKRTWHLFLIMFILLIAVTFLGDNANNAQRWIRILGISFQPTEMIKLLLILAVASFLTTYERLVTKNYRTLSLLLVLILFAVLFVLRQPDLGTTVILLAIASAQIIASGLSFRRLTRIFLFALFTLSIVTLSLLLFHPNFFSATKMGRFAFLDPFVKSNLDASYQLRMGYYGIADGGFLGSGFGESIQKFGYLPEAHTDFISAVISEELGIFGILTTISLLIFFVVKAFLAAFRSCNLFDASLAIGIATWISIQTFFNLGGVTGIIPLTGVPLPLISYGGSSIFALAIALGLLAGAEYRGRQIYLVERGLDL